MCVTLCFPRLNTQLGRVLMLHWLFTSLSYIFSYSLSFAFVAEISLIQVRDLFLLGPLYGLLFYFENYLAIYRQ